MTGIEIFFCGGFLLTAIFCLLFLTGVIKPVSQKPSEEKTEELPPKEKRHPTTFTWWHPANSM